MARTAAPDAQVVTEVPELRIIEDQLWEAAKARQSLLEHNKASPGAAAPFWARQRPRYLFSELMKCASCDGGFSKISAAHFGCSTARNKGESRCSNLLTLRHDRLEREVLEALKHRMMDPDIFREFVAGFTAEWNRMQSEASAGLAAQQQELSRVTQQIDQAVDAIVNGSGSGALQDRLRVLETRKAELERELASAEVPTPRLHPNLAELYRRWIAELAEALASDDAADARELIRSLVEEIRLIPEAGVLRIEVRGELGAILRLAEVAQNAKRPGGDAEALCVRIKLDAGTGFEPVTFRL